MSYSPLTKLFTQARYYHTNRAHKIDRLTIHCFGCQTNCTGAANAFTRVRTDCASVNYTVATDGITCHMDDEWWANASCSSANDHRAIAIETSCDHDYPYTVRDDVYERLLELVYDICHRHGIRKLIWFGDKAKSLAYEPKDGEMVMTVHRWFVPTACPGEWLMEHMAQIAELTNQRLEDENMTQEKFNEMMDAYLAERGIREVAPVMKEAWDEAKDAGYMDGKRPAAYITRQEVAQVIHNIRNAKGDDNK